ncbi:MAG: hypothetical protein PHE86_06225, partial [Candidatus Marinimicrobia bacterium]|nr:hypothetical protein [Candidatus Neomarinimicrobiota bacterium]
TVEVRNILSGLTGTVLQGQVCITTIGGDIQVRYFQSSELPDESVFDSMLEEPEVEPAPQEEPEVEPAPQEEPIQIEKPIDRTEKAVTPAEPIVSPEVKPEEEEKEEEEEPLKKERDYGVGLGIGSVTINGKIYNQFAARPTLQMGKFGVGLDIALYIDNEGNILEDNWNSWDDILDKIYFLSWGFQEDPFYIRVGGLDQVTIANGLVVSGYTNMLEYPEFKRLGTYVKFRTGKFGFNGFISDWNELGGESIAPGLLGGRLSYNIKLVLPISLGVSLVTDINPYNAFDRDRDKDGYSDLMDMFPDDKDAYRDTDGDGIPDNRDVDPAGTGGWYYDPTMNLSPSEIQALDKYFKALGYTNGPDSTSILMGMPTISDLMDDHPTVYSIGADVTIPVVNKSYLNLNVYSEAAILGYAGGPVEKATFGAAPIGLAANIIKMIDARVEYRWAQENFRYNFFDRNYDINRVYIERDAQGNIIPRTKFDKILDENIPSVQGIYGAAGVKILNVAYGQASYMHMVSKDKDKIRSFNAEAGLQKGLVPKISDLSAYYIRNNDPNPFLFKEPSENTIWGYRIGAEVSPGVSIVWNFMTTYRDKNGDGIIQTKEEALKITTIETGITF